MRKNRQNLRHRSDVTTPFIDMKFLLLLGFAFLFIVAFWLINPPDNKKVDPKAEAMILLTWPEENFDDIDTWLLLPNGKAVGYTSKDQLYVHLERDDLGITNDVIKTPKGVQINKLNREVIMFRQLVDGHYVLNLHYFRDKTGNESDLRDLNLGPEKAPAPVPCKITIIKLNPKYHEIESFLVTMEKERDEKTVVQFDIINGEITNFTREPYMFVEGGPSGVGARYQGWQGAPM